MSFRDWVHSPPIGVGIAVAILFGGALLANQQRASERGEKNTKQQSENALHGVPSVATHGVARVETPPRDPKPERNDWRQEEDLIAQQDMARWAWWMMWASIGSVFVTGIGIWYVRQTLEASRKSVQAAERAIVIENRPWIRLDDPRIASDLHLNDTHAHMAFDVVFKNVGSGPARILSIQASCIDFFADDIRGEFINLVSRHREIHISWKAEQGVSFPGEIYAHNVVSIMERAILDKHPVATDAKRRISPVIVFAIYYRTFVSDDVHYTAAAYTLSKPDLSRGGIRQSIVVDALNRVEGRELSVSRYSGLSIAV